MNAGVQVHGQVPLTRSETRAATKKLEMPDRYDNELLQLSMKSDCEVSHFLHRQILDIENIIMKHTRANPSVPFLQLRSVPGFDKILPWVVLYEVDQIGRFPAAGDFCSYAMLIPPDSKSAGKTVGTQGRKMGNHYLKWAFTQAVIIAKRRGPFKKYADRLTTNKGSVEPTQCLPTEWGLPSTSCSVTAPSSIWPSS